MSPSGRKVAAIRRFNRFYTRRIGILNPRILGTDFSLAEMRVMWEIAHSKGTTASRLCQDLGIDPGYASRIVARLRELRFVTVTAAAHDARVRSIELTRDGKEAMKYLEQRSSEEVSRLIDTLSEGDQERLVGAMASIESVLGPQPMRVWPYELRDPRPGEYGWIVHRHGVLYASEYGWDETFEALVAEIVAKFAARHDAKRERCWVAERNGEFAGCVLLVEKSAAVAQLRLLLVEPTARGLGLGSALVDQCIRFAREAGYRKVVLWTQSNLGAALRIYKAAGLRKVAEGRHRSFGKDLVGQTWELAIRRAK